MSIRIDAHQHFWRLARGDYGWLTPRLAPIYRDFAPDDLRPLLAAARIDKTILVQAAPSVDETRFLLDIAARTPFVAGVVGWVDFAAPDAGETIAALASDPLLVGLRPMLHDIPDPDWMLQSDLAPAFAAIEAHGLVFDALVRPIHLPNLKTLAERYPELAIVIDHGAKPLIASGVLDPWRTEIAALGRFGNVSCKLSGLVTEAGEGWTPAKFQPFIAHLLACFGTSRLMFGSDWPVCTLAAGYGEWLSMVEAVIAPLDAAGRAAILGGNAARIYLSTRGRR